ncbi:MAG: efflux RND transporter permease subunit, partial [Planctomycetes bacterium]|nr:efflux RND transporter permease subunit [Planctomycetota bacterium]
PTDADRVVARRWSGDSMPVMWFGIRYPIEFRDSAQRVVADVLVPRLEAVDGVASASAMGLEPRSIRILIDKETATANRLDIGGLYRRLQADNQSTPVGDLDSGGSRHIIRVEGRFESLEEIENFPIGDGLLIKDVGRVIEARSAPEDLFRIEGEYAMAMSVSKETSANTFEVCQRIETLLNETLKDDPILNVFSFEVFWSEGTSIRSSLRSLIVNALQGGLIAILILYGFLRHLGFTLLVTLSIPVSILATLAWLYFSGETFNMMSMMGITISIGMLVDNAVVIVESIVRRRSQGETIDEACVRGPAEMSLAITTATLTSIVVFLPLIFMSEDRMSKTFTHAIGIPLCVALMAALLVAQLVVPPACRYLARREKKPVLLAKPPATQGPASWMPRLVAWSLQNRLKAASLAILFLASGGLSKGQQSFGDSMGFGGNELEYRVNFTSNTTLQEAEGAMLVLEEAFDDSLLAEIGNPAVGFNFDRNRGEIKLWHDSKPSPELKDEIKAVLKERLPKHPRYEIKFEGRYDRTGTGDGWTRVALSGPESQTVDRIAREIREKALTDAAWQGIQEDEEAAREILVRLDRERLNRMGSTSRDVLGSIEYGMRGLMVSRYQTESGDLPVIMEY